MRKILWVLIAAVGAYVVFQRQPASPVESHSATAVAATATLAAGDDSVERAYEQRASDVRVHGSGTVERILSDDNDGSRHQRFIVRMSSSHTLLIAHNIDIAPRVAPLAAGDTIEFSGEYVWNNKGGVVHWTHHDPAGRHASGWIRHNGQTFQ